MDLTSKEMINMNLKTSGIKGKIGSSREGVARAFRLIRSLGKGKVGTASISEGHDLEERSEFNLQAYQFEGQRMRELEAQKAFIVKASRHDLSKSGGPY